MLAPLQALTAALYLGAGLVSGVALALSAPRVQRLALGLLLAGAVVHGLTFSILHTVEPTPPLTDLPAAISFMAWVGTVFFLLLQLRVRLPGLAALIGPISCLAVFYASVRRGSPAPPSFGGSGSWPHFHVLLSSAGLAMLGLAALAGALFLTEHRRLKSRRAIPRRLRLPSLEALDRTNAVALSLGFPLLSLGVVTGMLWVQTVSGRPWTASPHQLFSVLAWAVYALLIAVRFGFRQGARQAAASALLGFALLFFAVIGVGLLA